MRTFVMSIAAVMAVTLGHAASAQNQVVRTTSATTYVCPKCGKLHYRQPVSVAAPSTQSTATTGTATPIATTPSTTTPSATPSSERVTVRKVGVETVPASEVVRLAGSAPMAATSAIRATHGVSNVLGALNAQRARRGIRALLFDPQLQAVAQRRAQRMAASGMKNHPPGSFSPGRYEGVGWSSSYSPSGVSACFTSDTRMRYAGAAMATGRDGVYFAVVYR